MTAAESAPPELLSVEGPLRIEPVLDGKIWRLWLAAPKANVIDSSMIRAISSAFAMAKERSELHGVILQGEGRHFSFGASVEEHLPEQVGEMLPAFHRMFLTILDTDLPVLAAVSGQCLGGGLELAAFCHRVFATPGATLGQPETVLGVFAPVASVILPHRCGRGAAEDLCISGRTINGEEGLRIGLVDELADDPGDAALAYARQHLVPKSASSLRFATRAVRLGLRDRFVDGLRAAERLYLGDLMRTADAQEGIRAFVEKRSPEWRNQ
jgi:cyclohexa-1,5-dienecarbonyl-CoA hydratase